MHEDFPSNTAMPSFNDKPSRLAFNNTGTAICWLSSEAQSTLNIYNLNGNRKYSGSYYIFLSIALDTIAAQMQKAKCL